MKIKCNDGIVREFTTSTWMEGIFKGMPRESKCENCGELFGHHDTKILKPMWKEHSCKLGRNNDRYISSPQLFK